MFENQTLNKNRVLPSAMILDRLSIECIAKAATKEKIIESCCISNTKLVEQLVKSEPQYSKIVEKMADVIVNSNIKTIQKLEQLGYIKVVEICDNRSNIVTDTIQVLNY